MMVDIAFPEAPSVPSDPYRSLAGTAINSPATNGGVFNSYCNDLTPLKGKNYQDYYKNGDNLAAPSQLPTFGSIGDTPSPWRDDFASKIPSNNLEDREHSFYLGGDEEDSSEEEFEDEILSLSDEDHVAGFRFDEDSGIGTVSNGPSLDDEDRAELEDHPSELVSLPRSLHIGSVGRGKMRAPKSRKQKLQFTDFYKLTDNELGQGAYACVRTAVQKSTQKEFAVKLVNKHEEGHTRSRILREVEIFKMCKKHPNIVQLIEWFEDDDYFYMVFEKMRGGPLLNHIQAKSCFTEEEASQVTKDIASALKFLHDLGIAHRDVKPENILCTEPHRVSPVKLCDLDLASKPSNSSKRSLKCDLNSTGGSENAISRSLPVNYSEPDLKSPVGSAEFLAPEVVDAFVGEKLKYDKKCDLWALGVVIYVMLCGYPPFYGRCDNENCGWDQGEPCDDCQESLFKRIQLGEFDFPDEDWDQISDSAKDLIRHLLVKDVSKRFTADDVLHHPWVMHDVPQTPLQTVNNLIYRKDSARDISMMNENFDIISRFVSKNNPPIKEDSLSNDECSPPKEYLFDIDPDEPNDASKNVNTPTILLPGQQNTNYVNNNFGNYFQPPLINMNGTMICAPQMAPYVQSTNGALIVPQVCNGTTYYTPATIPQWMPNHIHNKQMIHQPRSFERPKMNNGSSLSGAISKLGLETCQNAMNRQGSSKNIRKQTRETQVNV